MAETFHGKNICYSFLPFTLFAFGMLWTTIMFAKGPENPSEVVRLFGLQFSKESFQTACALALRILSIAALSLLFIFTTNIIHFILSLMQQCKLSPKIAYGVLAGCRILPMMKDELKVIHVAQRIRGVNQDRSLRGKWLQYKRLAIPLLASAIRKAERTAIAMESKGFTGSKNRTFYRTFHVSTTDWLLSLLIPALFVVSAFLSWRLGYFTW
ncbi:energy-coupling factor transporter transmembrane component T [Virgibacillus halophilus]|uniref:Energy-coupling factor transporter transmembrane component T n=1 Tax=Tigheibacillus halophilus TaxID=361280 RepID=A0ABU5C873_9BACI|nr:energy-coupling factor transporter transmembrane component T [Virgibacillus halophilus]